MIMFLGRILKDNDTLDSYKIENDHAIHLVKGATGNSLK